MQFSVVSVCIATFRRPVHLRALLADLAVQTLQPLEIIVVDNDAHGSARIVVEERRRLGLRCALVYDVQPRQNISLARNRTVELARGQWIAFLDDDERVPGCWLKRLMDTAELHDADGALGPVIPVVPNDAPEWIRRGRFYEWMRMRTGRIVPLNGLRFGNVVLRARLLKQMPLPFDPAYGLTGGEDGDLLTRLVGGGARIVWCDEAYVNEPVVDARLSLRWLTRRALRGGQDYARHFLAGRYKPVDAFTRLAFLARALGQCALASALSAITWTMGRHVAAFWWLKAAANAGKLTVFYGWHYREYALPARRAISPP